MKFNKWTLGLAAVGAVSMASAVRADEAKLSQVQTALSNTTLSGVVDVGAQWNMGNAHNYGYYGYGNNNQVDNFSLNQLIISLDKPLDETPWSAGYHVDLNWGQDAVGILNTPNNNYYDEYYGGSVSPVRQAYVTMITPVGNGITWKAGLFDNILGYESNTLSANPNYSHSMGWEIEPTSQLGLTANYKINDEVSVTGGLANSYYGGTAYSEYGQAPSEKTFLGALALTAPDSWGWAKGAVLNLGVNGQVYKNGQNNYFAGLTLPTPNKALTVGATFDLVSFADHYAYNSKDDSEWIAGLYTSFQATDKLTFSARGEYNDGYSDYDRGEEVTLTTAYKFWANMVSRVELRWNHADTGRPNGWPGYNGTYDGDDGYYTDGARVNDFTLAFNVAYQF